MTLISRIFRVCLFMVFCLPGSLRAQTGNDIPKIEAVDDVAPQPLLAHAIRLNEALSFLGSSLSPEDATFLRNLKDSSLTARTTRLVQQILDPYCLAIVNINPEARVRVLRGPARATLVQGGWTSFLVKVHNQAGITARLEVESPNAKPLLHMSMYPFPPYALKKNLLTPGEVENRFLEVQLYRNAPLLPNLSGLNLEYAVVQIYCKDAGQREGELAFNVGQGSQDIGFRNAVHILFKVQPAVKVRFRIQDENSKAVMASFIITDGIERVINDSMKDIRAPSIDYRFTLAQVETLEGSIPASGKSVPKRLTGIYPLPSRRLAASDEYPDFFFQPQVYRFDGEHVLLPPGKYNVSYTRGPEYIAQTKQLVVPTGIHSMEAVFKLKRWIDMSKLGWYSADHHIHAAGCSHYESPEQGVKPADMWRQVLGEDLNVGAVLAWGPGWYHQKDFFTGNTNPLSTKENLLRYDVEVSGFPSSHAGHVVLLRLKEDDYPGTSSIEDWPSWTGPVLTWARSQGAVTGYAHSGNGLQPMNEVQDFASPEPQKLKLPDYDVPRMDGIGANEYIVSVTQNLIDFYSLGNTPAPWELNMWYHTLNCGFTPRISGETDFPCVYDERVGMSRSYFKTGDNLSFNSFIEAVKTGRCYVSDGAAHIIDYSVNGLEMGTNNSRLAVEGQQNIKIKAKVAAYLPARQDEDGAMIAARPFNRQPFWNIERARIDTTRMVWVELIANGKAVDSARVLADGNFRDIGFRYQLRESAWLALRISAACHTNPIFVEKDGRPIQVPESAAWCKQALAQCWKMKQDNIRPAERTAAKAAYDKAEGIYDSIIRQSQPK